MYQTCPSCADELYVGSVDKKLTLSKLQSGIWEKQSSKEESFDISGMDESILQGLIEKDLESDEEKFNL